MSIASSLYQLAEDEGPAVALRTGQEFQASLESLCEISDGPERLCAQNLLASVNEGLTKILATVEGTKK